MTVVMSPTDDQSIDIEQSQSPSRNGSAEIATDAPVECLSPVSEQDIESVHLTSEESKSVEESSSVDSHTVTSPDMFLLTGSHSDTDVLSSSEKKKQPDKVMLYRILILKLDLDTRLSSRTSTRMSSSKTCA